MIASEIKRLMPEMTSWYTVGMMVLHCQCYRRCCGVVSVVSHVAARYECYDSSL